MRQTNFALALLAAAVLSACGGSDNNTSATPTAKPKFASEVVFGDSLSDVGTYKVGAILALGGGKYTINNNAVPANALNWTELMAAQFGFASSCAAQTGLDGTATGFIVPLTQNLSCTNYAQGGSRVTNPIGPGHKLAGSIGQLTHPIVQQVATHLARNGGKFAGTEVVFVMAGGNDALALLGGLEAAAAAEGAKVGGQTYATNYIKRLAAGATNPTTAAAAIGQTFGAQIAGGATVSVASFMAAQTAAAQQGNPSNIGSQAVFGPMAVASQTEATAAGQAAGAAYGAANGPGLVTKMSAAASELGLLIRNEMVAKGAKYVVLNNLPDLASAPASTGKDANTKTLIAGMVSAFNTALAAGVDGLDANVLQVDVYSASRDQVANPSAYGITNATTPACAINQLAGSSLVCNGANLIAGDTSKYLFADTVHPTPYGSSLIAKLVAEKMVARGWL